MNRVIAAIDNSAAARPVLTMARALVVALAGGLEALHVSENGDETARASAEAVGVALRTLSGDPLEQLAQVASEGDVVALVLGARGALGGPRPAGHLALGPSQSHRQASGGGPPRCPTARAAAQGADRDGGQSRQSPRPAAVR